VAGAPDPHQYLVILTGRERELVGCVALGKSNEEIGRRPRTQSIDRQVTHKPSTMKLGARGRAQLVVIAS
jgi:DNA-binding CsgD family transcriptional regulator